MAITKLARNEISIADIKAKLNEVIDALNGADTTVSRNLLNGLLIDLPTANVASPAFYLNSGVVTKGTA